MNIVLIGYRGTGKTSVATLLASKLQRELVSTDAEIVKRVGKSIPDIVAQQGWDYFRKIESEVCRDFSGTQSLVIDTGGGAILRPENAEALKRDGKVFWLTASVPTIVSRIQRDTERPSLTGNKSFTDEVQEVLRDRVPKYEAAADYTIETDNRSIESVVDEIIRKVDATAESTARY
ncbi:MAG TPA: shikimate kinase [Nitrospira sp.]|nr:shikimate kinase [Nitrospira sp.]